MGADRYAARVVEGENMVSFDPAGATGLVDYLGMCICVIARTIIAGWTGVSFSL